MRVAEWTHMVSAFQQRRRVIASECKQLKTDVDSYNDNHNTGDPVQLVFDFTDDIAEREALESLAEGAPIGELAQSHRQLQSVA
ncbi:MAG: hypothetical protein FJX75_25885 [Armatimonadetes bacterium]|nr:hypothetical protein [Armatimonadota bacterium]